MSSKSFLEEVREVAIGKNCPSDLNHPHLSAQLIGEMCCTIVDISKERGYIPKGRVREFEARGQGLKEQGIKDTAWFYGADFVLERAPSIFEQIGASIDPAPFDVFRFPVRTVYEKKRTNLAKEFVALSDELLALASRRPGRPKGKGEFDKQDYEIILNAMAQGFRHMMDGGDWPAIMKEAKAALQTGIVGAGYPQRGSADKSSDQVHLQRIKRKIPQVVDALKRRADALEQRGLNKNSE